MEVKRSPLWPTVTGEDGHSVVVDRSEVAMDTAMCNPSFVQVGWARRLVMLWNGRGLCCQLHAPAAAPHPCIAAAAAAAGAAARGAAAGAAARAAAAGAAARAAAGADWERCRAVQVEVARIQEQMHSSEAVTYYGGTTTGYHQVAVPAPLYDTLTKQQGEAWLAGRLAAGGPGPRRGCRLVTARPGRRPACVVAWRAGPACHLPRLIIIACP